MTNVDMKLVFLIIPIYYDMKVSFSISPTRFMAIQKNKE